MCFVGHLFVLFGFITKSDCFPILYNILLVYMNGMQYI
jgi:hypothetical protein